MAYGNKDANFFKADPNIKGGNELKTGNYTVVIEDTNSSTPGLITIWDTQKVIQTGIGDVTNYRKVGTIPVGGTFTTNPGSTLSEEIEYFSDPNVKKAVINQAKLVVNKSLVTAAKDADRDPPGDLERSAFANKLLDDGTALTPEEKQELGFEDFANSADISEIPEISIEGQGRPSYGDYYYPKDISTIRQDKIKFIMKVPKGSKVNQIGSGLPTFQRTYVSENIGSVTLPIQPMISDRNSVDWAGLQLNAIDAAVAGASYGLAIKKDVKGLFTEAENQLRAVQQTLLNNKNIQQGMQVYLAQEAANVQGLLSRTAGAVLNPNLELLFRGPQLRPFTFTFTLSPREESEGEMTRNIIRFFKQGMSVKTTASNVFLKSPNVFDIQYKTYVDGVEVIHPSINTIKTCALIDCSVEYTPDGSYMTFNDEKRTMTSYRITLQFSETEPIYDKDYSDYPDENFIGF